MVKSIYYSRTIYNYFQKLRLGQFLSDVSLKHIMAIVLSVFMRGFHGKVVDFAAYSPCHRTTVAHFLNNGKWDDSRLEGILKQSVRDYIYHEALSCGKPVFCIVDDTIASHTKPSSKALHPIEDAYFHQSHLKKKQDYGHQAVSVMLSCNGIVLNYATIMYDKSKSKIRIIQDIAGELPVPPVISYFLCDSWYTSAKVMDAFIRQGFHTIGALRTNRVIYPCGIKQKLSEYALHLRKTDTSVSLVTAGSCQYYVYRYEGKLNGVENAVVLLSYPKDAFLTPRALRAFISTDVSLSTREILDRYMERWSIEVFFRQGKNVLAFDKYQIRSSKGIHRYWLIISMVDFICCTNGENYCPFEKGYKSLSSAIMNERIEYLYDCGKKGIPLADVLTLVV